MLQQVDRVTARPPAGQRFRRQVRQRQRLGLGQRQRAVRQGRPAHGRGVDAAQHLPVATSRACRPGTRCGSRKPASGRARRRRRPDGRDEPADLGRGRRRRSSRAAICSTTTPSRCRRRSSATTSWCIGVPLTEITNKAYTDSRQRQLFKNIVGLGALSTLLDMDRPVIEQLLAEQFKGRDKLIAANVQALHMGRDWVKAESGLPDRPDAAPRRHGRRPHLHRGQRRGGAGRGLWRRDGLRVVSDHAVVVAGRGVHPLLQPHAGRQGDRQEQVRHRPGRGRTGLDRHGHRRGLEWRARVHRDLRPWHLADAGVRRAGVFRRNPGGDLRRAARPARPPACRRARSRPTSLTLRLCLPRRHQARAADPGRSLRVLRVRRAGVRSGGPAANADLRHARSGDRHE